METDKAVVVGDQMNRIKMEQEFREKYAHIIHAHFDVESDGPRVEENNMVAIGFAFFEPSAQKVLACARFNLRDLPNHSRNAFTWKDFWSKNTEIWDQLHENQIDPAQMVAEIVRVKEALTEAGNRVIFVSDNSAYDWQWLDYYVKRFNASDHEILGKSALDMYSYGAALFDMPRSLVGDHIRALDKKGKINKQNIIANHDPAMDALAQAMKFNDLIRQRAGLAPVSGPIKLDETPSQSNEPIASIRDPLDRCIELPPVSMNKICL